LRQRETLGVTTRHGRSTAASTRAAPPRHWRRSTAASAPRYTTALVCTDAAGSGPSQRQTCLPASPVTCHLTQRCRSVTVVQRVAQTPRLAQRTPPHRDPAVALQPWQRCYKKRLFRVSLYSLQLHPPLPVWRSGHYYIYTQMSPQCTVPA